MTIRSGGRPRDDRSQAHPADEGTDVGSSAAADPSAGPATRRPNGRSNGQGTGWQNGRSSRRSGRRSSGMGLGGVVRFFLFAIVLGATVLILAGTALRPFARSAIVSWASDSPGALGVPFVADLVREDLGDSLTQPASTDTTQLDFFVNDGESATSIARRLEEEGFLRDSRAFVFNAVERGLTDQLVAGSYILRKSMTPDELVTALLDPPEVATVDIDLRTGLRLEQITAKLETIEGLELDPKAFYDLAKHPPAELVDDYDWLKLPKGASLEGYLWPATYRVLPDTSAEELIRLMLDKFEVAIGDRMTVPAERGLTWDQVLTLASLVEKEAILDDEKPLIAGVYQNRLDGKNGHLLLQADPTVIYANDTVQLSKLPFQDWKLYAFGKVPGGVALKDVALPPELEGYNTYRNAGLPPGPIATPTLSSIDAALSPDTKDGYVFFVAKNDGSDGHAFAKTAAEHEANLEKYGYR
jgi:UPF0755 protein